MSVVSEIPGVQNPVTRFARGRGWYARRMKYLDRRGCPDTWFMRAGKLVIVEWKRPGGELEVQQVMRIRELRNASMTVHVIDNADAGRELFESFDDL